MWRYVSLIVFTSLLFTAGIFAVTLFYDAYLPLIEPVVCGPEQTLTADVYTSNRGTEVNIGNFYCMSGADRVSVATLPVILIAMVPSMFAAGILLLTGVLDFNSRRYILNNGEKAVGRVTNVGYTGMRVNEQPVYKVTLEVFSHGRDVYTTTTRKRFGYFGISGLPFGIGALLPLRIDPRRPDRVFVEDNTELDPVLVRMAGGATTASVQLNGVTVSGSSMENLDAAGLNAVNQILRQFNINTGTGIEADDRSLAERLRELQEAYDTGLINAQEYETQRKRLLDTI